MGMAGHVLRWRLSPVLSIPEWAGPVLLYNCARVWPALYSGRGLVLYSSFIYGLLPVQLCMAMGMAGLVLRYR
jgi:hypothetical protein